MARILVVDDEPANRMLVTSLLKYAGHQVEEAQNVESALEAAKANRPDLVILDLYLPGMHGTQLVKALRDEEALRSTRLALYTGTQVDGMLRDFMNVYGIAHVIPKPSEPEEFLRIVGDALEG